MNTLTEPLARPRLMLPAPPPATADSDMAAPFVARRRRFAHSQSHRSGPCSELARRRH